MAKTSSIKATRSRGASPRVRAAMPAMALMEALVAAAIAALALGGFLVLARGGATNAAMARERALLLSAGETLLAQGHAHWPEIETTGRDPATRATWRLSCTEDQAKLGDRLTLVTCVIELSPASFDGAIRTLTLRASRAHART